MTMSQCVHRHRLVWYTALAQCVIVLCSTLTAKCSRNMQRASWSLPTLSINSSLIPLSCPYNEDSLHFFFYSSSLCQLQLTNTRTKRSEKKNISVQSEVSPKQVWVLYPTREYLGGRSSVNRYIQNKNTAWQLHTDTHLSHSRIITAFVTCVLEHTVKHTDRWCDFRKTSLLWEEALGLTGWRDLILSSFNFLGFCCFGFSASVSEILYFSQSSRAGCAAQQCVCDSRCVCLRKGVQQRSEAVRHRHGEI